MAKNHTVDKNISYNITKGKNEKFFFLFPTLIFTKYKTNSWSSETKSITFYCFKYFIKWNFLKINKNLNHDISNELIDKINYILTSNNYYIDNIDEMNSFLKENTNLVIFLNNSPKEHKYVQNTLISIIKYYNFVKENNKDDKK